MREVQILHLFFVCGGLFLMENIPIFANRYNNEYTKRCLIVDYQLFNV